MKSTWKHATWLAIVAVISACGGTGGEEPQAAPEESAPKEATVADPDHYRVELETDRMRVVRIRYGPGEESVMHFHPDHVTVFLTDLEAEFAAPDGTRERVEAPAGGVVFMPAGSHHPRSTRDEPFEAIAIEFKTAGAGETAAAGDAGPDPVVVDPDHYAVELDNDQARVLRVEYPVGAESVMHYHPEHLAVFLSDQHFAFTTPDGTTEEVRFNAGQHYLAPAGQHRPKNLGNGPATLVLIEPK